MAHFNQDLFLELSVHSNFPVCVLNSSWSMFFAFLAGVFLSSNGK